MLNNTQTITAGNHYREIWLQKKKKILSKTISRIEWGLMRNDDETVARETLMDRSDHLVLDFAK